MGIGDDIIGSTPTNAFSPRYHHGREGAQHRNTQSAFHAECSPGTPPSAGRARTGPCKGRRGVGGVPRNQGGMGTQCLSRREDVSFRPRSVCYDNVHLRPSCFLVFGSSVTYETSYLPFLFPSLHDTPAADGPSSLSPSHTLHPRGRRVFNKRGEEITQEVRGSSLHHRIIELTIVPPLPGLQFKNGHRPPSEHTPTGIRTDKKGPATLDIVYRHAFSHREAVKKGQQGSFQGREKSYF